ncbi:MAG: hypothetical protein CMJ78_06555 [Planctomycetaceae bacterium]|nr:hypothetical protein [Planctomycetaceae bacterium]
MRPESAILVVDPERAAGDLLAMRCRQLAVSARAVTTGERALECLDQRKHSLVILDGAPEIRCEDTSFLELMATAEPMAAIPTIVLHDGDRRTIGLCRDFGHMPIQRVPQLWNQLQPVIRRFLDMPEPNVLRRRRSLMQVHGKILSIDDDPRIAHTLQIKTRKYGLEVLRENNAVAGFHAAVRHSPDLIITEFVLPQGLGSHVLGRLRDCDIQIPVIFLTNTNPDAYTGLQV